MADAIPQPNNKVLTSKTIRCVLTLSLSVDLGFHMQHLYKMVEKILIIPKGYDEKILVRSE